MNPSKSSVPENSPSFITSARKPKGQSENATTADPKVPATQTVNVSERPRIKSSELINIYSNASSEQSTRSSIRSSLTEKEVTEVMFSPPLKLDEDKRKSMGRVSIGRASSQNYHKRLSFIATQEEIEKILKQQEQAEKIQPLTESASSEIKTIPEDDNEDENQKKNEDRDSILVTVNQNNEVYNNNNNNYNDNTNVQVTTETDETDSDVGAADSWEDEFNPFLYIKTLPPYEMVKPTNIPICLPPKSKFAPRNTLVLDLDETLVHCNIGPIDKPDCFFTVSFEGYSYDVYVKIRPYFYYFLEEMSKIFEIVVFTASQKVYANKLLDLLDPEKKYIKYRVFRDSCLLVENNYVKDLSVLGRNLANVVIIDNSPHAFGYNLDNGIPITSWFDDLNDKDLLLLIPFLRTLSMKNDVRPTIHIQYNLKKIIDSIVVEDSWN
ncbi:hypothetical protein WA158_004794 [Blastocystis sp. Blastoise]